MDLEFYADFSAVGHYSAQTCLKNMSARKNKVPKQIKFQLDLPTRGDLMGGEPGGGTLIAPENIKRELPDDLPPSSGPRSLGSMQKVPSLSDLSEESSLAEPFSLALHTLLPYYDYNSSPLTFRGQGWYGARGCGGLSSVDEESRHAGSTWSASGRPVAVVVVVFRWCHRVDRFPCFRKGSASLSFGEGLAPDGFYSAVCSPSSSLTVAAKTARAFDHHRLSPSSAQPISSAGSVPVNGAD
ncbi:hypothetical protein MRX96_027716 [Rhipicephalus microplus]